MRQRPGLGSKRTFGVFRANDVCLVAVNVVLPIGGAKCSPNLLAGFERPLQGGRKKAKRKWSGRKGRKGSLREKCHQPPKEMCDYSLGGSSLRSTAEACSVISRRGLIGSAATLGGQCRLTPRVTELVHVVAVYRQEFDEISSTHFAEHCKSSAAAAAADLSRTSLPLPTT